MRKTPFYPAPDVLPTPLAGQLRRADTTYVLGALLLLGLLALAALVRSPSSPAPTPDTQAGPGARWEWRWVDEPTY